MNLESTALSIPGAKAAVTGAIQKAARVTGTDFQYLLATAKVESNLNPHSSAPTSSAKGLFQFIEQTWLGTLKEQGPALGLGKVADAIARLPSGQYAVADPRLYDRIMKLRNDPGVSAVMAGAFTKSNSEKLAGWLGRQPSGGELYVAHFFGADGAAKLIDLAEARPTTPAASMFPGAAAANPSIFYDRAGRARSAAGVYRLLVARYDAARAASPSPPPSPPPSSPPSSPRVANILPAAPTAAAAAPRLSFAPDQAPLVQTYADAARMSAAQLGETTPVFHGLFRTGERRQAVAPVVSVLWSAPSAAPAQPSTVRSTPPAPQTTAPSRPGATPSARPATPLDLFKDQPSDVGALFRGRV